MRLAKFSTKKIQKTIDATVDSVEIDLDFTQMYDCFFILANKIKSVNSFPLLFFLLRIMAKDNVVVFNKSAKEDFNRTRRQTGQSEYSDQTFHNCINDLIRAEVMKRLPPGRAKYFVNPFAMWKADKNKRTEYIRQDSGPGQTFAINPINLLLNDVDHEYKLETMQEDLTDADIQQMDEETE